MPDKLPPPKGVRSMSSLAAEAAASAEGSDKPATHRGLRLVFLQFSRIRHFGKHPFRLYTGERLTDMVESIRQNGILMPLIVRHIQDDPNYDYEMLSGHNRMNAGQLAGLEGAWCLVKEGLSDGEALMYVVETNLMQRSFKDLLPSEKAAVLTLRYSEMFSQGKRSDILRELEELEAGSGMAGTCGSDFHKSKKRDALGDDYELSGRQVATYLRLDKLTDLMKVNVDAKRLTLASAVSLSYLGEQDQDFVAQALEYDHCKPTDAQIATLRKLAGEGPLTICMINDVLHDKRDCSAKGVRISQKIYAAYFAPDTPKKEVERVVKAALELYFSQQEKQEASA